MFTSTWNHITTPRGDTHASCRLKSDAHLETSLRCEETFLEEKRDDGNFHWDPREI